MGKVTRNDVATDSSDDERRKTIRQERRTKKKKHKKDLTDLSKRLFKSKKDNVIQADGKLNKAKHRKKTCNRILPKPSAGIYRNGAAGKEIRRSRTKLPLNDINNARLQGNVLKLFHGYDPKSDAIIVENNTSEVSNGTVLNSCVDKSVLSPILGKVDGKKRHLRNEDIQSFNPSQHVEQVPRPPDRRKINSETARLSVISRYEELCTTICTENFVGQNFSEQHTPDPLTTIKNKLRSAFSETFHSQFLRDLIKRGTVLNECESPDYFFTNKLPSKTDYCASNYGPDTELTLVTADMLKRQDRCRRNGGRHDLYIKGNSLVTPETRFDFDSKGNEVSKNHLLFDTSLVCSLYADLEMEKSVEVKSLKSVSHTESEDNNSIDTSSHNYAAVEVNHSTCNKNNINLLKNAPTCLHRIEKIKNKNKPVLFLPTEMKLSNGHVNKKNLINCRNQYTQTSALLNSEIKKHHGKNNLKALQDVKIKNLKHIPTILRKCKSNRMNLFNESIHMNKESREVLSAASKQNLLFTPHSLELNENSERLEDFQRKTNVRSCPVSSPNSLSNKTCFTKNSGMQTESKQRSQNITVNDIFATVKDINPPIQKTIMFTRKDLHNIGHCLHLNNLIADETEGNSNVNVVKKNVFQTQKLAKTNCTAHRNCQRITTNCRSVNCSQNVDNISYGKHELHDLNSHLRMQNMQVQQEPTACEKVLLRRVEHPRCESNQKFCRKTDERIRYVVLDQYKDLNNMHGLQDCSNNSIPSQMESQNILQNDRCCQENIPDVSILQGVQNLQILPVNDQNSEMNIQSRECIGNTLVFEEQPIKYLAFESDSKTQKIPIFMQSNKHVTPIEKLKVISPKVNYRVISCPPEATQKVILLPSYDHKKLVYVNERNLHHSSTLHEGCIYPREVVLCQPKFQSNKQCVKDSSNLYDVHIPTQNVVKIRNPEFESVVANLKQAENGGQCSDDRKNLLYRRSHKHPVANDDCTTQTIFYQK